MSSQINILLALSPEGKYSGLACYNMPQLYFQQGTPMRRRNDRNGWATASLAKCSLPDLRGSRFIPVVRTSNNGEEDE